MMGTNMVLFVEIFDVGEWRYVPPLLDKDEGWATPRSVVNETHFRYLPQKMGLPPEVSDGVRQLVERDGDDLYHLSWATWRDLKAMMSLPGPFRQYVWAIQRMLYGYEVRFIWAWDARVTEQFR